MNKGDLPPAGACQRHPCGECLREYREAEAKAQERRDNYGLMIFGGLAITLLCAALTIYIVVTDCIEPACWNVPFLRGSVALVSGILAVALGPVLVCYGVAGLRGKVDEGVVK